MHVPAAHVVVLQSADHVNELLQPIVRVIDPDVWQPTGVYRTSLGAVQLASSYRLVTTLSAAGAGRVVTQPYRLVPSQPSGVHGAVVQLTEHNAS